MLLWFDTLTFSTSFLSGLASEANKSRLNVVKAKLALGLGQVKKDAAEASKFSSLFDPAGRRASRIGGRGVGVVGKQKFWKVCSVLVCIDAECCK